MESAFYDAFLTNYVTTLRQFQGGRHQANCTALACAVDSYFTTGSIVRVSGITSGEGYRQTGGTPLTGSTLMQIIGSVRRGEPGNHVVIEAEDSSGSRHHFANIIKIRQNVYYVDGFNIQQPVCSTNISGYLNWASTFHYSIGLRVQTGG